MAADSRRRVQARAQHTILRFYPHTGGASALARFGANCILMPFAGSVRCGCSLSRRMR